MSYYKEKERGTIIPSFPPPHPSPLALPEMGGSSVQANEMRYNIFVLFFDEIINLLFCFYQSMRGIVVQP